MTIVYTLGNCIARLVPYGTYPSVTKVQCLAEGIRTVLPVTAATSCTMATSSFPQSPAFQPLSTKGSHGTILRTPLPAWHSTTNAPSRSHGTLGTPPAGLDSSHLSASPKFKFTLS